MVGITRTEQLAVQHHFKLGRITVDLDIEKHNERCGYGIRRQNVRLQGNAVIGRYQRLFR